MYNYDSSKQPVFFISQVIPHQRWMRATPPKSKEESTYRKDYKSPISRPTSAIQKPQKSQTILNIDKFEFKRAKTSVYQKDFNSKKLFEGNIAGNYEHIKAKVNTGIRTNNIGASLNIFRSVTKKSTPCEAKKKFIFYPRGITEDFLYDIKGMDQTGQINILCRNGNPTLYNPWSKAIK